MSDDTTARALRAIDKLDNTAGRASKMFEAVGVGPLNPMAPVFAVARAALKFCAPMPDHWSLRQCGDETDSQLGELSAAITALAEHAPDEGDDR